MFLCGLSSLEIMIIEFLSNTARKLAELKKNCWIWSRIKNVQTFLNMKFDEKNLTWNKFLITWSGTRGLGKKAPPSPRIFRRPHQSDAVADMAGLHARQLHRIHCQTFACIVFSVLKTIVQWVGPTDLESQRYLSVILFGGVTTTSNGLFLAAFAIATSDVRRAGPGMACCQ